MRQIVLYGLLLGASLLLIQYTQYRLLWIQHSESLYTGIVAAICCVAGIWSGIALTQKWQLKTEVTLPVVQDSAVFAPDEKMIAHLNITPRELEVLALIAQGLSNREIAAHLFLSLNTIKTHTSNVFSKLNVQRRTQAIQKAKALGVI